MRAFFSFGVESTNAILLQRIAGISSGEPLSGLNRTPRNPRAAARRATFGLLRGQRGGGCRGQRVAGGGWLPVAARGKSWARPFRKGGGKKINYSNRTEI
jgi:hypothetical protein